MNLDHAIVYDVETFPNAFTLRMESFNGDLAATWEISEFRDDRQFLMEWFNYLHQTQTPMIGFNNLHFDYKIIHYIFNNPHVTVQQIYEFAMSIINSVEKFGGMIWADNRFAPQIDLYRIHHFDNKAKSTNLKALQINMRSETVVDMPHEFGKILTKAEIDQDLIPYNNHDVSETNKFAHFSLDAINFRISLIPQFGVDVLNWPDTKIGVRIMEDRLGKELCYEQVWIDTGFNGEGFSKKRARQTPRTRIALGEIIFPFVQFEQPEFRRVLSYLQNQVLGTNEIQQFGDAPPMVQTKGVFTDLKALVGGIEFYFGTGGIHGSVSHQKIIATDDWLVRDIDVAALYPSIAIVNGIAPAHLGQRFVEVYSQLPEERKKWQKEKGKKCVEANTLKLASNGVYGNSNNPFSVFFDPQYTLTTTINGQLMLCMLAERLLTVPTLKIIQINTDGITYFIHRDFEPQAAAWCKDWERLTRLVLESVNYSRMWIRDVNNYVAEGTDRQLKLKGAYWTPDPLDYYGSISNAQPPAWHKDLGNVVTVRAAVAAMVHGVDPSDFVRLTTNPYDFMCRVKVKRSDQLFHGREKVQRNTRYYLSHDGQPLNKVSPPAGPNGAFKKANGVDDAEYVRVMNETGWQWDSRVCTKNKSKYEARVTAIQAGFGVKICNDIRDFSFANLNYDWHINEAAKLVIS